MKKLTGFGVVLLTVGVLGAGVTSVFAQAYPRKAIRLVVPYAPGGGTDIVARMVSPKLSDGLGQQVIVDNRAGAGAIIGTELVAKSAPDGYTVLMTNPAHTSNPSLRKKLPYDTLKDFSAVGMVAFSWSILVVHPSVPANSVGELVALAKANPGKLKYATAGTGSAIYLAMEQFKNATGIDVVHIAYKGAGPALNDVLGNQVPMMFITTPAALPHVKAGKLRVLAVSSAKRHRLLPDVPTVAESGYPGFESTDWYGLLVPTGTPAEIAGRLNAELNKALAAPDVKERILGIGAELAGGTSEQMAERLRDEMAKWAKIITKPVEDD